MTSPATAKPETGPRGFSIAAAAKKLWAATARFRPVLIILIALFAFFTITQPNFFTGDNLRNMLTGVSILWVISLGLTFVLISAGLDLSIPAIVALSGIFLANILEAGVPPAAAAVLTVLFGGLIGAGINGLLIGKLGLSFFVVTLGSLTALTGVVNLWSNTETKFVTEPLFREIGMGSILSIPIPIWIMGVTLAIALYLQHRTFLGRDIFAIGGSRVAARLAGIRTVRTTVIVYGISGLCAGIVALIAVGRIGGATPQIDASLALQAAAAVLLGGTSLMGGSGGVGGTVFGVLFIGVMQNGLSIAGVESFWQQVVTGCILILAVFGDRVTAAGGFRQLIHGVRERVTDRTGTADLEPPTTGDPA